MNEPLVLISLLPGIFLHAFWILSILLVVASMVLKVIPFINSYYIPIRVVGFTSLLILTYMEGGHFINNKWMEKGKEMQERVAQAEARAAEENVKIEERVVEKTKIVKEKGDVVVQYVDRIVKGDTQVLEKNMSEEERKKFKDQLDELNKALTSCPVVPSILIDMHNDATKIGAKGEKK